MTTSCFQYKHFQISLLFYRTHCYNYNTSQAPKSRRPVGRRKPCQVFIHLQGLKHVKASLESSLILTFLNLSLMLLHKVSHNKMYRERQVLIEATTETMASTEVLWLGFNVKAEGKTSSSRDATKFPVYAIQLNMLLMLHSRYIRTASSQHLLSAL